MRIPNKIKIGSIVYAVEFVDDDVLDGSIGDICRYKNIIRLSKTAAPEQLNATFWHEVIHAINDKFDEITVEFLALSLNQIFTENEFN